VVEFDLVVWHWFVALLANLCQRECNNVPEMGMKSVPPW
jgi:hypothetical protein